MAGSVSIKQKIVHDADAKYGRWRNAWMTVGSFGVAGAPFLSYPPLRAPAGS